MTQKNVCDEPIDIRLMLVTTVAVSVRAFLLGHIRYACEHGASVEVVCGKDAYVQELAGEIQVPVHHLPLRRAMSPLDDLVALVRMWWLFRRRRPDVVHAHTSKAGLIGMLASFLARVPNRVYTVHGLVHPTRHGLERRVLMAAEYIACRLSHRVLCVSPSVRRLLVDAGLCSSAKSGVVTYGSICGVDADRFARSPEVLARAEERREAIGLPAGVPLLGFVGRLTRDKGINELHESWVWLRERHKELRLLVVGEFEEGDPVPDSIRAELERDARVHFVGWQSDVVPYMALMTVLALPTHREGFGLVLIEAASMGIPTVATRIPGCVDAIDDGVTGILVPAQDGLALGRACDRLLRGKALCDQMGRAGRMFARTRFDPGPILAGYFGEYQTLMRRQRRRDIRARNR